MAISSTSSISDSLNALVSAYETQLRKPLRVLQAKKSMYEQINSAFSILDSYLKILKDLSYPLKSTSTDSVYYAKSATSSDTSVITATAAKEAASGVHTISISQLAKNYTQVGKNYTSADTRKTISDALGAGTYEFKIMVAGTTTDISVDIADGDTDDEVLSNIASAINLSSAKVNAAVVHQTSSDSRLILASETTGNEDTILIRDTSGTLIETIETHNAEYTKDSETRVKTETLIRTDVGTGDKVFSISVNGVTRNITVNIGATDDDDAVLTKIMDAINASDVSKASSGVLSTLIEVDATHEYLSIMNAKTSQDSTYYTSTGTDIFDTVGTGTHTFTMYVKDYTTGNVTTADISVDVVDTEEGRKNETILDAMATAIEASGIGGSVDATVETDGDGKKYLQIVSTDGNDVFSIEDETGTLAETTSIIGTDLFSIEDITGTLTSSSYVNIKTDQEKTDANGGYIYDDTELNSKFILDSLNMERTSNTVTDAVTGLTFSLLKVQTSPDVTIQVSNDVETVKGTVELWLDSYNSVLKYLYETTRIEQTDEEEFEGGPLSGEYFYKDLIWKLRSLMATDVDGVTNSDYSQLSHIGITTDSKGYLSISDSSKFESALSEDITNISDLFNSTTEPGEGKTKGKAVELYNFVNSYVKAGGYIDNSEDAYTSRIDYLDERIARMEASIERKLAAYRKSLGAMQEMMALLQGQYTMLMMYYGTG